MLNLLRDIPKQNQMKIQRGSFKILYIQLIDSTWANSLSLASLPISFNTPKPDNMSIGVGCGNSVPNPTKQWTLVSRTESRVK